MNGTSMTTASAVAVPVLVVDDNASKRLALRAILSPLGHSIVEADSGEAALRCVMDQDFAVILLDVNMPHMDGFETAALIRLRRQSEMTPIIFITAYNSEEMVHRDRYAEGAVDFMFAPVAPEELRAKVSVFANLFIKAEQLAIGAREVQASADQLRLLTDAAPIGIFQTDAENRYSYTNPRWSEITGIAPEEVLGKPWDTIVDVAQRSTLGKDYAGADRGELSHRFEIGRPDEPPRIVLLTSKQIPPSSDGAAGWVGTLADVTAEAGAEAAMSDARDQATAASGLKSDFLANMSHEIRTPMNGVIGMTDLLLETELDELQRDYAQTVRNSGEALLAIISDILDFSKVEAGMLEVEDVEFNVQTIVDNVVDLLAGGAQAKNIELVAVVDSSVPETVSADAGRVRQILTNLVGNAIKFTREGEVVVRVTQARDMAPESVLRFEVADTGDGIPADKLEAVFQPFIQADSSTSRRYGGTGLGLAISSQLVTLMGGQYGASSEVGAGSLFWFTVPARTIEGTEAPPTPSEPVLAGVHALVVDDNATHCGVLSDYLTGWGMIPHIAGSGPAALATLRTAAIQGQPFVLVLADLDMPGMDGLDLAGAVAADPTLSARIVLMTGLAKEDREAGARAGVSGSLSKPIHPAGLLACVLEAVTGKPGERREQPVPASSDPFPDEVGRLLLAEDNPVNTKVALAMLATAGYVVDTVVNGVEAVEAAAIHQYHAILMDCQMPEMNGFDAAAAIRAQEPSGVHTPIIALTAGARREDRDRCLAAGMDAYLAKPMSKDALLSLVARSVTNRPVAMTALTPNVSADDVVLDAAIFEELQELAKASDEGFLAQLIEHFVVHTEPRLTALRAALAEGDLAAVAGIAHTIRGGCGQLGGRRLASSCSRLERKAIAEDLSTNPSEMQEIEFDYEELCRTLTLQVSSASA